MLNPHGPLEGPESFTPATKIWSISDLTSGLRQLVEQQFEDIWVEGEISNFKQHSSGHCYFSLKDADSQIRCVMWRSVAEQVFFKPRDGMLVRAFGSVSVYEARGELQLVVRALRPAGEGALQKAFEALKKRLASEGLFDQAHKVDLPRFPETIGVVTSGDGAALRDILSILARRFPLVQVLVSPVHVQGAGASDEIAAAVRTFNELPKDSFPRPDCLIVTRGGGSIEDLWPFNEEVVARAIYDSVIPVVSAVGHETDFTIADFVADVRAATPSMAAEVVVPNRFDVAAAVDGMARSMRDNLEGEIIRLKHHVRALTASYAFRRPVEEIGIRQRNVADLYHRLSRIMSHSLQNRHLKLIGLEQMLRTLDPDRPLELGFARVERGKVPITRAAELHTDDLAVLRFKDGARASRIL